MNTFYGFTLDKEVNRLESSSLTEDIKDAIKKFLKDVKFKDNLTENRLYFYAVRLRKLAEMIPDSFLNPTENDLKNVLDKISKKRHNDGNAFSENTIEDYKIAMRRFYKWHLADDMDVPKIVKWIKKKRITNRDIKPDSLVTESEISLILENCKNPRDKALFSTLYDSGCRIGEIMSLRNKDVDFDQFGAILSVTGKTGFRKVRVVGSSVSYLREWQNFHPHRNDPDFWLFCGIADSTRDKPMTYDDLHSALKKTLQRAGIKRRIYPHLFRHTRATLLASRVTEAPLEAQMGWVHGSRMTRTYVHISGRDQDNAILKAYGIDVPEDKPIEINKPIVCPRCKEPNDSKSRFCWKCGMVLDKSITENKLKQEAKLIETSILKSDAVDTMTKEIVKGFPEDFKDLIIESVLQKIVNDPQLRLKFTENMNERTEQT